MPVCVCTWGYVCEHTCKCACMPVSVCVCVHVHVQGDKDGVEGEITERISHSWAPQDSVPGPLHGSFCVSLKQFYSHPWIQSILVYLTMSHKCLLSVQTCFLKSEYNFTTHSASLWCFRWTVYTKSTASLPTSMQSVSPPGHLTLVNATTTMQGDGSIFPPAIEYT